MTPLLVLSLLTCTGKDPVGSEPTHSTSTETGTETETETQTEPTEPTGTTEPTGPVRAYDCPSPPADALTFSAGTVLADQMFHLDSEGSTTMPSGWLLILTGASYTHSDSCETLVEDQALWVPIKDGSLPGEYLFELLISVPGRSVADFLGEHPDNGGLLASPDFSAHWLRIGWHDGEQYHWVDSLPHGWTRSTVCVGDLSEDYAYLTVLFDPVDGPYLTNHRNPLTQKIWFDVEILATHESPRSCFVTGWQPGVDRDAILSTGKKAGADKE